MTAMAVPLPGSDSVCTVESLVAQAPITKDAWGEELAVSPERDLLFVQANARPGIPGSQFGAIDVYELHGDGTFTWIDEITPVVPEHDANFGEHIVALNDMLIVSAWSADVDGVVDAGQVFSYRRTSDGWIGEPVVEDPPCPYRYLGTSIAANDATLLVTGLECASDQKVVRVYRREGDHWLLETTIRPPNCTEDQCPIAFGAGLAVGPDFLAIADPYPEPFVPLEGIVHICERKGGDGAWEIVQSLTPSVPSDAAEFGSNMLVLDDDTLLIVARYEFSSQPARVYIFTRGEDGVWAETDEIIVATDSGSFEQFGHRLALAPDRQSFLSVARRSFLPAEPLHGVVYHIDLKTGAQKLMRPVNAWSDRDVVSAAYLTNDTILIGESNASPFGLQYAGQVFRVDLNSYVNCHQDLTRDGTVGVDDLVQMLSEWGSGMPSSDLDCSGAVDFMDVLLLLSVWGECAMPPGI